MELEAGTDPPDPNITEETTDTTNSRFSQPIFFCDEFDLSNVSEFVNVKSKKSQKKKQLVNSFKPKISDKQLSLRPLQQALAGNLANNVNKLIVPPRQIVQTSPEPTSASPSMTPSETPMADSVYRKKYTEQDPGPYMVHVTLISDSNSTTSLHPLKFGNFLKKSNLGNILQDGIKRVGRNRLAITFKTHSDANIFISNMSMNPLYNVVIPTYNICKMGLIKGIPQEWTHEDIVDNLQIPEGYGQIIKSRRLNRKSVNSDGTSWIPTQTVVLTFDGQSLPSRVYSFFSSIPVEQYIYPTVQCFNCCRFGHTRVQCRSKPRCNKCGGEHSGLACNTETFSCVNCRGEHMATNKSCPEFSRQTNIKKHMSQNPISYQEASKLFPIVKKSYSQITSSIPLSAQSLNDVDSSNSVSYKKTVIKKPKQASILNKGYDKSEYKSLIRSISFDESQGKVGSALQSNKEKDTQLPSSDTLNKLLSTLINIIANSELPEHVALSLINNISLSIFNIFKYGQSPPVEL